MLPGDASGVRRTTRKYSSAVASKIFSEVNGAPFLLRRRGLQGSSESCCPICGRSNIVSRSAAAVDRFLRAARAGGAPQASSRQARHSWMIIRVDAFVPSRYTGFPAIGRAGLFFTMA